MSSDKHRRDLRAGERLFHEGDPGDCAYLVEAGVIDVKRKKDAAVIGTVKAGELLGEMALLDGRPRTAGAVAREAASVRVITRAQLQERLRATDPLLRHLLHLILERYRAAMGVTGESALSPGDDVLQADREDAMRRLRQVHELTGALERKELKLVYEPVILLQEATTAGFAARVRWEADPALDVAAAVRGSALALDMGRWMLKQGCADLRHMSGAPNVTVAVAIAGRYLLTPGFADDVTAALKHADLPSAQLLIDVPEAELTRDAEAATAAVAPLRSAGVRITASEFGIGDSSLSKLGTVPLDALKLDPSFVTGMQPGGRGAEILKVMAALAHALRVPVVVEGVENAAQAKFLSRYGLEYAQGPYFGGAVPPDQVPPLASKVWSQRNKAGLLDWR